MICRILLLTLLIRTIVQAQTDQRRVFRAGAATSNITPFLRTDLIGGFLPRGSTHTFVFGLANGGLGYLPSPRQHELGGYETWLTVAHAEVGASPKLAKKLTDLFSRIHPETTRK